MVAGSPGRLRPAGKEVWFWKQHGLTASTRGPHELIRIRMIRLFVFMGRDASVCTFTSCRQWDVGLPLETRPSVLPAENAGC